MQLDTSTGGRHVASRRGTSQTLINHYLNQRASFKKPSGLYRESVLREALKDLLKSSGRQRDLTFIPEYVLDTLTKNKRFVDGALLYSLRVQHCWRFSAPLA